MTDAPILIAGAGIGGLALAAALRRRGRRALVLEERDELGEAGAGISLWPNALAALDDIGLGDTVRDAGSATSSGGIRRADGRWLRRLPPGAVDAALGEPMVAIHRATLLEILAAGAGIRADGAGIRTNTAPDSATTTGSLRTGAAVRGVREHADGVTVTTSDGAKLTTGALIGADGIRSAVAAHLAPGLRWRYSGYTAWRAVADIGIDGIEPAQHAAEPAGNRTGPPETSAVPRKTSAHPTETSAEPAETWGPDGEFGYVALGPDRTYWFATQVAAEGQHAPHGELDYLADRRAGWHEPIATLLRNTHRDAVIRHDIHDRSMPRRWASGRVVLIGDAAHPMRPHLGQGGCQAIIDAAVLARLIETTDDMPTAFARFDAIRRRAVSRIVRRSALAGKAIHAPWPIGAATRTVARRIPERLLLRQLAAVAGSSAYRPPAG